MKILFRYSRLVIFSSKDDYHWLEVWLNFDYYNLLFSITILTHQIGIEYIWKHSKPNIKKYSNGWFITKHP